MAGALEGIRVVEIGDHISAPYCAKLLADLGADVVKIEPPEGDSARRYGPFRGDVPDSEGSGLFVYLNANKRGISVDLRTPAGRAILDEMLASADILVENVDPADLGAMDLDYAAMQEAHPGLVITSISTFGRQGPRSHYRGHGLQASAGSTIAYRTGDPKRSPLSKPLDEPEFLGGLHSAVATLLAERFRERSGQGQHIDIATQDLLAVITSGGTLASVVAGARAPAARSGYRVTSFYPWTVLPVADGYMEFICMQDRQWRGFLEEIGNPAWGNDPRFDDMWTRPQFAEELDEHVLAAVGKMTRAEIWRFCRERMISFQPVHRIDELVNSDHLKEREFFREVLDGEGRPMTVPGPPYKLSGTPWAMTRKAPRLGEHTAEILVGELGRTPAGVTDLARQGIVAGETKSAAGSEQGRRPPRRATAAEPSGTPITAPLQGIRVLDFGQVWAGPLLGCYLADYGAQVIKIGSATRDAMLSTASPPITDPADPRAYDGFFRNRLHISLNLNNDAGRALFRRLVAASDVVFDNFSPRGAQKLGLRYEQLREYNPKIIVASLSAAGQTGPWSDVVTYGPSLTALFGIKSLLGYAGETRIQEDVADLDPTAGTYAMLAIMAALRARDRTGEGQFIDMAQGESGAVALGEAVLEYTLNGRVMGPTGNQHRTMAPHGIYRAAGDDAWVSISVDSEPAWQALCTILRCDELRDDARFASLAARLKHRGELDRLVEARTCAFDADELTCALQSAGVASYPVLDIYGAITDEQLDFRRKLTPITAPGLTGGDMILTGSPWRMSVTPGTVYSPTRLLGADDAFVYHEVLGLSDDEIATAAAAGAFT